MEQLIITYLFLWGFVLVVKLFWVRLDSMDKFEKWMLGSLFHAWIAMALIIIIAWGVAYYKTGKISYGTTDELFKWALK